MTLHKDITLGNMHVPYNWTYADATARGAASVVAGDVGKFARQLDDNSIWILTDDSPLTWVQVGSAGAAYTDEDAMDAIAAAFAAGTHTGITVTYTDGSDKFDLAVTGGGLTQEQIEDFIGTTLVVAGTNMTITYNDAAGTLTFDAAGGAYSTENAQDDVAALFASGTHTGITVTYNDATPSIDLAVTITQYTDEMAEDAIAALFAAGTHTGITVTYTDATPKIDLEVTGGSAGQEVAVTWNINEGGVPTEGEKAKILVPFAHTVERWYIMADTNGDLTLDVWKENYSGYPPADANTITAAAKPTLASASHGTDSTLTGWTTSGSANDIYVLEIEAVDVITEFTFVLVLART